MTEPLAEHTLHRARRLRREQTDAEKKLWRALRSRNFEQYKFRRQRPIGKYFADFVCLEKHLVIEVDGGQHTWQNAKDEKRTEALHAMGFRVIRFWNNDVLENLDGVVERLGEALRVDSPPSS